MQFKYRYKIDCSESCSSETVSLVNNLLSFQQELKLINETGPAFIVDEKAITFDDKTEVGYTESGNHMVIRNSFSDGEFYLHRYLKMIARHVTIDIMERLVKQCASGNVPPMDNAARAYRLKDGSVAQFFDDRTVEFYADADTEAGIECNISRYPSRGYLIIRPAVTGRQ